MSRLRIEVCLALWTHIAGPLCPHYSHCFSISSPIFRIQCLPICVLISLTQLLFDDIMLPKYSTSSIGTFLWQRHLHWLPLIAEASSLATTHCSDTTQGSHIDLPLAYWSISQVFT